MRRERERKIEKWRECVCVCVVGGRDIGGGGGGSGGGSEQAGWMTRTGSQVKEKGGREGGSGRD